MELIREPYVAIIFGSLGNTVQQLDVYERLHRTLGASLVVIIQCGLSELFDPQFVRTAVEANLDRNAKHAPVVAHVFGNGGMLLYHHVFAGRPVMALRVTAVIFDSTPGKWFTMSTFLGYLLKSSEKPVIHRAFALLPLTYVAKVVWALLVRRRFRAWLPSALPLLLAWAAQHLWNRKYFKLCADDPVRAPTLYLYSLRDTLVKSGIVERIVARRRRLIQKGYNSSLAQAIADNHVRARCWDDSSHVAHYSAHPLEYRREVDSLLREVLPKHKHRVPRVLSLPVLGERSTSSLQREAPS